MSSGEHVGRRYVLGRLAAGAVAGAGTAGCTETDNRDEPNLSAVTPAEDTPEPPPARTLDVAGWPVAGGELLSAIVEGLAAAPAVPDATATTPSDGRRGTFDARLGNRLAGFDPPSTFLTVAGQALAPYEQAVHLHPIPDLYPANGAADWQPQAHRAVKLDGTPFAVPVAMWGVNRWCYRPDLLEQAEVAVAELTDPDTFAQALRRIEARTDATGIAIARSGAARFALLCDCLGGVGGRTALVDLSRSELRITPLEAAARRYSNILGNSEREVGNGNTAADKVRAGTAAFTRATPRRLAQLNDIGASEVDVTTIPGLANPLRIDVLAMPFPKRNPSPVATERALGALQSPGMAERIGHVPGVVSANRTVWDGVGAGRGLGLPAAIDHAAAIVRAPHTGCGLDASDRWRVIKGMAHLPTVPNDEALRAALSSVLT